MDQICDYGCGNTGRYYFSYSKKFCCSDSHNKCPQVKRKNAKSSQGKIHSDKTKKMMSEQRSGTNNHMYGKNQSEKTKKIISEKMKGTVGYWTGKKRSEITKHKISCKKSGVKLSKDTKLKMSISKSGANHPNWKGGVSIEPYCNVWSDNEYKNDIKNRDGNLCLNPYCLHHSNNLVIHHIDYIKKNCHPFNLITVCVSCNAMANKDRKWHTYWYQAIIHKRYGHEVIHEII